MNFTKKAQVLLTEKEYKTLEEVSHQTHKKIGTLIREAVEIVYVENLTKSRIADSVDRLLALSPSSVPDEYEDWEKEYTRMKSGSTSK
jgi:hypothetical protein